MSKNESGFDDLFNGVRILTVRRLSKEKEQDLTINALAILKNAGYNIKWCCISDYFEKDNYKK